MSQSTISSPSSKPSGGWEEWRYQPVPGHWDEAVTPSGFPRTHWRQMATAIARMGRKQFDRRWQAGQALIQANGVAYNFYGDPNGRERLWPMDPIPLAISESEWAGLERAINQRAVLLNALLSDCYGSQRLMQNGALPPELVLANPSFLRPCFGVPVPGEVRLQEYAADLARSPDGRWWVIADRTQAPSGAGYALENRMVSARTLPSVFTRCPVRHLARFFQMRREGLLSLAKGRRRVVILTPGPYNETYFEHSYLAKHWGFPLVEGADLTVRQDRVYLKTLAGLEPVDLILRRLDDEYCDPLELRGDSLLGVAGLLQAVRAGNVVISNALGSGLVETPALMAFLPGLCRQLLGEELGLPSVATWWAGQEGPRRYMLQNLKHLVIKPAFPRFGQRAVFGAALTGKALEEMIANIEARPEQYLAQEQVALSVAPIWSEEGLLPRHVVMRVFASWDGSGYSIMPGGLTRVSNSSTSLVVSMQKGGGSKDTWVLGGQDDTPLARPHRDGSTDTHHPLGNLPSRVADNLFWLGRYSERAESLIRLIRVLLPSLSGEEDFGTAVSLDTAIHVLCAYDYLPKGAMASSISEQRRLLERAFSALLWDPAGVLGLGWNLKQIRRVAWQLKERLSGDTWRVLQQLESDFARPVSLNADQRLVSQMALLDRTVVSFSAFSGLLMENTVRGHGWRFLDFGRRLERAFLTLELLDRSLVKAPEEADPYLELLLQVADSSITYRARYVTVLRTDLLLELLLRDESNPRAIGFQIAALAEHTEKLPERFLLPGQESTEQLLTRKALELLRESKVEEMAAWRDGGRPALAGLLSDMKAVLVDLSATVTGRYLSHIMPSRLKRSW